jgi:hypothetical protein
MGRRTNLDTFGEEKHVSSLPGIEPVNKVVQPVPWSLDLLGCPGHYTTLYEIWDVRIMCYIIGHVETQLYRMAVVKNCEAVCE